MLSEHSLFFKKIYPEVVCDREGEFLSLIGGAEKQSEHPLAQAIVDGIHKKGVELGNVQFFEAVRDMAFRQQFLGKGC